jgi:hypothetical protein
MSTDCSVPADATPIEPADAAPTGRPLADVLHDLEAFLRQYVIFGSAAQRTAVRLWIAHTHALDAFDVGPYLNVRSAEKRSGKTRLLEVLHELVPRPWRTVQPSEAVLFRKIEKQQPTLLLDEVDAIFKGPPTARTEGLRSMLNAGYRRGATVDRCNSTANSIKLVAFKVFCPKVLAGIGTLPDTVDDRCIPIVLARKKRGEQVARFRLRDISGEAAPLREALAAWAPGSTDQLRDARPDVPDALGDRAAEVWEPLLAIADEAGSEWPARARGAAVELNGGEPGVDSLRVLLLRAIRATFQDRRTDRMLTADLLAALIAREGEPWAERWGQDVERAREKGTTPLRPAAQLAGMLRPFEVLPVEIRTPAGEKGKGYKLEDFADAFERYVAVYAPLDRDTATTVAAQGFEVSRSPLRSEGTETAETLGAQGLSRCRGSEGGFHRDTGSAGGSTELFEVPPAVREPGEEG